MAKFKFDDVMAAEERAEEPVLTTPPEEPKKQRKEKSSDRMKPEPVVSMQPDGEPRSVWPMLQELRERLIRIELIVTAHWPEKKEQSEKLKAARDAVAGGEPRVVKTEEDHPPVDKNGHPKLANGTVAQWAEVPSADALLKAANAFIEKNGKKAFKTLLDKYKAGKLTEVAGDENQAKFMAELQG